MILQHSHATKLILFSWIYALFLAIDANFRLQRKKVSSDERDPGLSAGWAYFVEETLYKSHLANYGDQEEQVSTTNGDQSHY